MLGGRLGSLGDVANKSKAAAAKQTSLSAGCLAADMVLILMQARRRAEHSDATARRKAWPTRLPPRRTFMAEARFLPVCSEALSLSDIALHARPPYTRAKMDVDEPEPRIPSAHPILKNTASHPSSKRLIGQPIDYSFAQIEVDGGGCFVESFQIGR